MDVFEKLSLIILPILITAFFASIIPRKLKERQGFNDAAAKFRAAFTKAQRLLDPTSIIDRSGTGSAMVIVKDNIGEHEIAMINFKPFVSKSRLKEYEKAWHDYADKYNDPNEYSGNNPMKKEEGRKLALDRINNLLEFAKHK